MNARERYLETLLFGRPDRVPLHPGGPRESTLAVWHKQGLPSDLTYQQALSEIIDVPLEAFAGATGVAVDFRMIPTFEEKVLEHRDGRYVVQDWMGAITEMPDPCCLQVDIDWEPGTAAFGMLLQAGPYLAGYYQVRVEPGCRRLAIDRCPRPGDRPFMLERPLSLAPGKRVALRLIAEGSCLVVYAAAAVALSCRMYDHPQGEWGPCVSEGEARFTALVKVPN